MDCVTQSTAISKSSGKFVSQRRIHNTDYREKQQGEGLAVCHRELAGAGEAEKLKKSLSWQERQRG
jgi:hypothetical protein